MLITQKSFQQPKNRQNFQKSDKPAQGILKGFLKGERDFEEIKEIKEIKGMKGIEGMMWGRRRPHTPAAGLSPARYAS